MRKLATVRQIDAINPIPDADAIEVATIGGWKVVVKKGEFTAGDLAVYFEIDSWIPHSLAPFLSKNEPKEYNGVPGERLRTVRLRKQLSQGLLLPLSIALGRLIANEGEDVSDELNIQKWEAPINPQLAGQVKGNFPSLVPKTDQERIQNLSRVLVQLQAQEYEVTEKLEGSSMTCYLLEDVFGVCSRNLDLKPDENNTFWKTALEQCVETRMRNCQLNGYALQGELVGPGVQGNIYKLQKHMFYIFDVYCVQEGRYLLPHERVELVNRLGLLHVPVLHSGACLAASMDEILASAEGASQLRKQQEREGVVYKACNDATSSFKAISNKYLLKS